MFPSSLHQEHTSIRVAAKNVLYQLVPTNKQKKNAVHVFTGLRKTFLNFFFISFLLFLLISIFNECVEPN